MLPHHDGPVRARWAVHENRENLRARAQESSPMTDTAPPTSASARSSTRPPSAGTRDGWRDGS